MDRAVHLQKVGVELAESHREPGRLVVVEPAHLLQHDQRAGAVLRLRAAGALAVVVGIWDGRLVATERSAGAEALRVQIVLVISRARALVRYPGRSFLNGHSAHGFLRS